MRFSSIKVIFLLSLLFACVIIGAQPAFAQTGGSTPAPGPVVQPAPAPSSGAVAVDNSAGPGATSSGSSTGSTTNTGAEVVLIALAGGLLLGAGYLVVRKSRA